VSIDSKEKRASIFGVGRPWMRDMFPVATPDEEWRVSCGNAYGGNALSVTGVKIMSNPVKYNFTLVRADTFADVWTIKDSAGTAIDLSAGTCKFEINPESDGSGTAILTATQADYITLGADGTVTFAIPPAVTGPLDFVRAYYDFELTLATIVETILFGDVTLYKDIA